MPLKLDRKLDRPTKFCTSLVPRPHPLMRRNSSGDPSRISWASAYFCDVTQQRSKHFAANPLKTGTDTQMEITNFTVVREVLHNNYQSCNLIGPYHFSEISPRNSTWSESSLSVAPMNFITGDEDKRKPVFCNYGNENRFDTASSVRSTNRA